MKIASYDTDLTDAQWNYLKPMLPKPARRGRPLTDRRHVMNAILYVVKTGVQWRMLPSNFPPWKTIYHIFRKWILDGTWHGLNSALRMMLRVAQGKRSRATAAILDSQSVKSDPHGKARNNCSDACWACSSGCASSGSMAAFPVTISPSG